MRISITGGLGFIGTALGSALSAARHDVRLVDIHKSVVTPGSDYLQGSVLNTSDCAAACAGVDVVVHCAAVHQANEIVHNPLNSIEVNVTGTLNLLHAAIAAGVKRFVFLSSAKIIGEPSHIPSVESDLPRPCETYALTKLTGEHYCHSLQPGSGMDIVILRPFSVYGPAQELDTGYVGMILSSLITGTKLRLPGQPEFVRDFVHIDDFTRLCSAAVSTDLPGVTTLNVGSGQPTSLCELVALAAEISGVALEADYFSPGRGTLTRMLACVKQAESVLGYQPMVDLRQGLAQTIEWFLHAGSASGKATGQ